MNEFVYVEVEGKNVLLFIRRIINNNIKYDKYSLINKNKLRLRITYDDYVSLISKNSIYKITVIKYYGFKKIKYLFLKYKDYFLSSIIGLLMIIILSNITFKIDIIHNDKDVRQLIKNELKNNNIKELYKTPSYKKRLLVKKRILKENKDKIEWLEIEDIGTKYVVKVEQRKKNKKEKQCSNRSIVAKKDAMILSIEAEEGEVVKKKLDYVKKGDVIISGLIYNKEDIVSKRCARGKVYGEIWYKVNLELPKKYYEEKVTGKTKKQIDIRFLNKRYTLFNKFKTYKRKSTNLLKSKILPISIDYSQYLETKVIRDNYTLQNVDKKATLLATSKLNDKLNNKDVIINKKVLKKYEKDSKILVEVFFKVKEDITDTISIDNINIDDENVKDKEQ